MNVHARPQPSADHGPERAYRLDAADAGSLIINAIEDHRRALEAEEGLYGDDFQPLADPETLKRAELHVVQCFRTVAKMQCQTAGDVQAKLQFLMHGITVSSEPVLSAILNDNFVDEEHRGTCGYELHDEFLRTLLLPARAVAS